MKMIDLPFENRNAAGRMLAARLQANRRLQDPLVMAVQPGGVPVALEVACALGAELDLVLVRKLRVPGHPELAMGAVASGGIDLRNKPLIREEEIGDKEFRQIHRNELGELQLHELIYRGVRPAPRIRGRSVILIDDGIASGTTMRAAVLATERFDPREIVVSVPVASAQGIELVAPDVDEVFCLISPDPFLSVGLCYRDFPAVSDDEVRTTLQAGWNGGKSKLEEAGVGEVA